MEFSDSINRFVDLVKTKPDSLFNGRRELISPDHLALLESKIAGYQGVICELGSGSGSHLIERAALDRNRLFVGFELRFKRSFRTVEKAELRDVNNLLIIRDDLRRISTYFKPQSLDGIYINFPDPWDKRRWLKHRVLTAEFLQVVASLLRENGFLSYKTDHPDYFEQTKQLIDQGADLKIVELSRDLYQSDYLTKNVVTEFEQLFLSKGTRIHYLLAVKQSALSR